MLVTMEGECKLADFGASAELKQVAAAGTASRPSSRDGDKDADEEEGDAGPIGTPMYMPPEQTRGITTAQSDVWSLGVMLCELCTGKQPWGDVGNILAFMVKLGKDPDMVPKIPEAMPPDAQDFARQCLRRTPGDRPPEKELLSHPFLLT